MATQQEILLKFIGSQQNNQMSPSFDNRFPFGGTTEINTPVSIPITGSSVQLTPIQETYANYMFEKYGKVVLTDKATNTTIYGVKKPDGTWDLNSFENLTGKSTNSRMLNMPLEAIEALPYDQQQQLKVTPIGEFPLKPHIVAGYDGPLLEHVGTMGNNYHVTYDSGVRNAFYNNETLADNKASYGCINCQKPSMENLLSFVGNDGVGMVIDSNLSPEEHDNIMQLNNYDALQNTYKDRAKTPEERLHYRNDVFGKHSIAKTDIKQLDINNAFPAPEETVNKLAIKPLDNPMSKTELFFDKAKHFLDKKEKLNEFIKPKDDIYVSKFPQYKQENNIDKVKAEYIKPPNSQTNTEESRSFIDELNNEYDNAPIIQTPNRVFNKDNTSYISKTATVSRDIPQNVEIEKATYQPIKYTPPSKTTDVVEKEPIAQEVKPKATQDGNSSTVRNELPPTTKEVAKPTETKKVDLTNSNSYNSDVDIVYEQPKKTESVSTKKVPVLDKTNPFSIRDYQRYLNTEFNAGVKEDGRWDENTEKASTKFTTKKALGGLHKFIGGGENGLPYNPYQSMSNLSTIGSNPIPAGYLDDIQPMTARAGVNSLGEVIQPKVMDNTELPINHIPVPYFGAASNIETQYAKPGDMNYSMTDHHMLSNLKDNKFNGMLKNFNSLGDPNSMLWTLPNTGMLGAMKGMAGLAAGLSGATLGYKKLFTGDKKTNYISNDETKEYGKQNDIYGQRKIEKVMPQQLAYAKSMAENAQRSIPYADDQQYAIANYDWKNNPSPFINGNESLKEYGGLQKFINGGIDDGFPINQSPSMMGLATQQAVPSSFPSSFYPGYINQVHDPNVPIYNQPTNMNPAVISGMNPPGVTSMQLKQQPDNLAYSNPPSNIPAPKNTTPVQNSVAKQPNNMLNKMFAPKETNSKVIGRGDAQGIVAANNSLNGLGMANAVLSERNVQRDYNDMLMETGNTDNKYNTVNPINPFGNFTTNVGPASNFGLVANTPIQDFGTKMHTAKNGGVKKYKEGGSYSVSNEELIHILSMGGEIEYI